MPIDANILLQARPTFMQSPYELAAGAQQLQSGQMENKLAGMKLQAADSSIQNQNKLASLMRESVNQETGQIDPVRYKTGLAQSGMVDEYSKFNKDQLEQQAAALEIANKKMDVVARAISPFANLSPEQVTPEVQGAWQQTVTDLKRDVSPDLRLPDQFDLNTVKSAYTQGMTVAQQHAAQLDQLKTQAAQFNADRSYNTGLAKFDYQQKHDAQSLAMQQRGQDISQATRQKDFDQRERGIEATRINKPLSPQQQKVVDATEMKALAAQAEPLLSAATSSGVGSQIDAAAGYLGASPPGANAAASLAVIGANMVSKIPKPPGAQSEAELKEAQRAAGRIADPTVPEPQKRAALKTILEITDRQIARQNAFDTSQPVQQPTPNGWDDAMESAYQEHLKSVGAQ